MSKRPKKLPYPSDLWNFNVQGRVVYYFGEDIENAEDYTLNLPIQVKTESYLPEKTMPGFGAANLAFLLMAVFILKRDEIWL